VIYFFVACTLCPKTKLPLKHKRAFTLMGENQAKSDILLVVVPIVVPNGSGFFGSGWCGACGDS